ncbi:MAG: ChbG/HpnK family deacetylase [Crocinitomicaceae bacterium]
MSNKRIIFTADDYGAYKEIDDGIINALKNGSLNSVAMLANGHDLQKSIRKIKPFQEAGQVEIGCHFTINSGYALSPAMRENEFFTHNGHFQPFFKMNFSKITHQKHLTQNIETLKGEIVAQLKLLMDNGIKVTHLSSHFNTLIFFKEFCQAQNEVLSHPDFKHIKIRSKAVKPKISKSVLRFLSATRSTFKGEKFTEKEVEEKVEQYYRSIDQWFRKYEADGNYTPKMADVLEGFHYQALGSTRIGRSTRKRKAKSKSEKLWQKYYEATNESKSIEFMFHLADKEFMDQNRNRRELKAYLEGKYAGVTPRYMDNRAVEYASLSLFTEEYLTELPTKAWEKI